MASRMTIRERIVAALHRQPVDQVPFTIYPGMIPEGEEARGLRALGLGTSWRVPMVTSQMPNVTMDYVEYEENGARYARRTAHTPVGDLSMVLRLGGAYGSSWSVEHYLKRPEDYAAAEFMVRDTVYAPNYEAYHQAVAELGEGGYVSGNFGYSPLMEMRVVWMGMARYAEDRFDRPDLFWPFYEALRAKQREAYQLLADSPAEFVIYCGNCSPEVLGRDFEQYVVPCYNELGVMLHAKGKMLGCHLDANNAFWAKVVADSQLDVIEALTPAPDTDMSMTQICAAWPGRRYWLNYPSSLHLASAARIKEATRELLADAAPGLGLIVGITENIPEHAWATSLKAIGEVLQEEGTGKA